MVPFEVRRATKTDLRTVAELFDGYRQFYGQSADYALRAVLFVARTVPHRFHDITERLSVLVLFAPAESV